ncbi:MAG: hypothetical protein K2Y26_17890 [Gemmatimonadaceae bacterium]|nr:hypothetical protein [Gemmatimonadaceae bacterium]
MSTRDLRTRDDAVIEAAIKWREAKAAVSAAEMEARSTKERDPQRLAWMAEQQAAAGTRFAVACMDLEYAVDDRQRVLRSAQAHTATYTPAGIF